jgi:hypothetical protein
MQLSPLTHCSLVLVSVTVLLGCTTQNGAPADSAKPGATGGQSGSARLSEPEVARIAKEAAEQEGISLSDYHAPTVHFEFVHKDQTWTVFFDGKVAMPGNHFSVSVDDQTGKPQVMRGE